MHLRAWISLEPLPLDAEVLRFDAREGLSELTDVTLDLACDDPDLDLDALLWGAAALRVASVDGEVVRHFHGVVEEATYLGARERRSLYRLRLRPAVHGLAYRVRSRVFQDLDVTGVVKRVLRDAGIPEDDTAWSLASRYERREFWMQYRESELDFVLRLLEADGIFFWFEHEADRHVLHFGDAPGCHRPVDGEDGLAFSRTDHGDREHVTDVVFRTRAGYGSVTARDWNWELPARPVEGAARSERFAAMERYDHPIGAASSTGAARRAHDRLRAHATPQQVLEGRSNCPRLAPGRRFDVTGCSPGFLDRTWLLLSVDHSFEEQANVGGRGAEQPYRATFVATAGDAEFRPPLRTPRPRVAGVESAVVAGPAGEEIHVDAMGRIKVHFYWDREGAVDDHASCWVRAQQQNTSGAMVLPRAGWEVSVAFVHGDPDRPVVLQKLYNQETLPPYEQPANATQTALQSSTSPGGGSTNELRMQDGNGGMELAVHASRDFNLVVGHDLGERVAVNAVEQITLSLDARIGGNESVSVGANQSVNVTLNTGETITGARTESVGGNDDWGVKTDFGVTTGGARSESVGGMMNVLANEVAQTYNAGYTLRVGAAYCVNSAAAIVESAGGDKREMVGAAHLIVAAKAVSETVGGAKTLASGAIVIKTGKDVGYQAKGAVAFNVGGPMVETCGDGFNVTAEAIVVTAPGGIEMKGGGSVFKAGGGKIEYTAGKLTVKATTLLQLKGKINYKS